MTTPTTNMGLKKAQGTDNARDYLKTDLAAGLDIIDGHGHTGTTDGVQIATEAIEDEAVTTAKIADGAITVAKLADGVVPLLAGRQGGDPSDWDVDGTTDYTPTSVQMQAGREHTATIGGEVTITFPIAFDDKPLVFVSLRDVGDVCVVLDVTAVSASGFTVMATDSDGAHTIFHFAWLAIGPVAVA